MEVQLRPNRHALSHDAADPLEDVALAIIVPLGRHRTMQRQDDHVDGQCATKVCKDFLSEHL